MLCIMRTSEESKSSVQKVFFLLAFGLVPGPSCVKSLIASRVIGES